MKKNLLKTIEGLFQKVETTETRYEEALERKQEQLIQLQGELQEKNMMLKDMHKMKLLGDITEDVYEAEKQNVEVLQKKVQEVQREMELISVYRVEDAKTILSEMEAEKTKIYKDKNKELDKLKLELLDYKLSYLNKMLEAREKYNELVAPDRKLDSLKIKLGMKNMSYVSGSFDALFQYSIVNGGYESLKLEQQDIYNCLEYGRTPERLNKLVQDAKEKSII